MPPSITQQLEPIFSPKSVAIIGASLSPHKWGAQLLKRLRLSSYPGRVYPINPREKEISGLPAYPRVQDVPEKIDLAIITVKAEMVPRALSDCAEKGIKGAIIITADFAETGSTGQALQDEIIKIADDAGIRFVGPNCFGVFNADSNMNTLPMVPTPGHIGFISQSGSLTHMVARAAMARGHGLSKLISAGNQANLDVADYLEYLSEDENTKVILVYLEGFKDGRKLFDIAKKMAGKKPVIMYKPGRNPQTARVAKSHTASMIGEDRIFDAMCRQVGFLRADELFDALDMASILLSQPLPKGRNLGIQGTGGQCVILADTCLSLGMKIPELNQEQMTAAIKGISYPPHAPKPSNPIDFAGSHTAIMDATVISNLAGLDHIDAIISNRPITRNQAKAEDQVAQDTMVGQMLADVSGKLGKPVILLGVDRRQAEAEWQASLVIQKILDQAKIPTYSAPEDAAKAMNTLVKYAEIKRRFS